MSENSYETIKTLLASEKPEELHQGLELVKLEISRVGSTEAKLLFELVSAIFHIDSLDRPDLAPVVDEVISLVAGFGGLLIPALLESLDTGDIKAQLAISNALGRIGEDAIEPLIADYEASTDPVHCQFILYAMGKIKSPRIVAAAQIALEAAQSPNLGLRDTATRAIGKFVESIPASDLSEELKQAFVERLRSSLADSDPGIRAKAIRSFGKLARYGHLSAAEREKLKTLCRFIMGVDENFDWDRAYIVRREAEEALKYT